MTTKQQFLANAQTLRVNIACQDGALWFLTAEPHSFKPDADGKYSVGYYCNGKLGAGNDVAAYPICVTVDDQTIDTTPFTFSSQAEGARVNGKVSVKVAGEVIVLQVSGNLTEIGSKPGSTAKRDGRYQVGINLTAVHSKTWAETAPVVEAAPAPAPEAPAPAPEAPAKKRRARKSVPGVAAAVNATATNDQA